MQLLHVRPTPLIEQGLNPDSEIFNTNCTFEQGKNYLIKAASGKGKSTFLHILMGLRHDFDGKALSFIDGKQIDTRQLSLDEWAALRARHVSMVFQDLRLFLNQTAWENIALKLELNAQNSPPPVSDLKEWAKRLGIDKFLDKKCETLSYGQRQRVAILRALAQPFSYLLLDEPFSHLDADNIRAAQTLIQEVCAQQNAGIIMVSLGETYGFKYHQVLNL